MVGNEPNAVSNGHIERDYMEKDNTVNQNLSVDEKTKTTSKEDSTQVVKFQDIDHKDSVCSEVTEKNLPPIPDGGWGWVVVVAAFVVTTCSDGLAYSFGILHDEFMNYFGQSQTKTSWIGSLFIAIPLIFGPIMSALVERFGCRIMTILGSLVATGGFLLAAISNSVELLMVTLGIISGLAMGILYVTSVVAVAFWFDKRRSLAISIASSGIGFGTVIFQPFTNFLLQHFDWRNTIIILAGVVLNVCVCGALMREPDWLIIKVRREKKTKQANKAKLKKSSSLGSISIKTIGGESTILSLNELNDLAKSGQSPEYILSILSSALAESKELEATTQMNAELAHKRNNSSVDLPTFIHRNEQVPPEVMEKVILNQKLYNIIQQNYPDLITSTRTKVNFGIGGSALSSRNSNDSGLYPHSFESMRTISATNELEDQRSIGIFVDNNSEVLSKEETTHNGYNDNTKNVVYNEKENKSNYLNTKVEPFNTPVVYRRALLTMPEFKHRACSLPDINKDRTSAMLPKSDNEKKWYDPIKKLLHQNFNFKLLTELHFLMFNITSVLMSIWSIIPFFFLNSYMSHLGIEGAPLVISMIGVSSGVGIVVLGWFGDQPWFNVTKAYAVLLIICGISVATYPFVITNYPLLITVSIVFGLSFASSYSYTPVILMELVPIEEFTVGYGMVLMSQGIGNLIGPPIGGLLNDVFESWNLTFFMGGGWLVFSGFCIGTVAYVKNVRICGKDPLLKDMAELKNQVGADNV